jgi:hypothetical protein
MSENFQYKYTIDFVPETNVPQKMKKMPESFIHLQVLQNKLLSDKDFIPEK